jgi:hypothetical protein
VFTPMMIEDGRQLIISNLNLDYMVESGRDEGEKNASKLLPILGPLLRIPVPVPCKNCDYEPLSLMGVEFFKLFPHADEFKLSTAVRMNASFPFLSPAAALPTDPVRHVVDAGYYDNYGMMVATKWFQSDRNRDFLTQTFGLACEHGVPCGRAHRQRPPNVLAEAGGRGGGCPAVSAPLQG